MAISQALVKMMTQEITICRFTGSKPDGSPIHNLSAPEVYKCRINYKTRVMRDSQGVEKVSSADITVGATPRISPQDKVTLPDGKSPVIIQVQAFSDEKGPHHEVVYV